MTRGTALLLLSYITGSATVPIAGRPPGHLGFLDRVNRSEAANLTRLSVSTVETEVTKLTRPLVHLVEAQLEYELSDKPKAPKVDKLLLVLLCCLFGACGFDRCFMGNICLGFVKGFTFGGFGIWAMVDQAVVLINAMGRYESINTLGFHARFYEGTIDLAQKVAFVIVILVLWMFMFKAIFLCCTATGKGYAMAARDKSIDYAMAARQKSLERCPREVLSRARRGKWISDQPTVHEIKSLFDEMDKDGNGWLDAEECKNGLMQMGCPEETVGRWIKAADLNSDGKVNFAEFVVAIQAPGDA